MDTKDFVVLFRETFDMATQEYGRYWSLADAIRACDEAYFENPQASEIWITRVSDDMQSDLYHI